MTAPHLPTLIWVVIIVFILFLLYHFLLGKGGK